MESKIPDSPVYFRFLNLRHKTYHTTGYSLLKTLSLWSTYTPQYHILNQVISKIQSDQYVLCVLYGNSEKDTFTDIQFGVTESFKKGESIISAFKRSLGEELGLITQYIPAFTNTRYNGKEYVINTINIKDTSLLQLHEINTHTINTQNNIPKKMASIVYGDKKNVLEYLNAEHIILHNNTDNIVGIVAIPFKEIIAYFNKNPGYTNKHTRLIEHSTSQYFS
jgi:hypothetical protein|uniref:Uncharacterized protein n=1 Tax=viral metagenome TaxID=1070528 RepID=A0A6C0CZS6_9ZZZZ